MNENDPFGTQYDQPDEYRSGNGKTGIPGSRTGIGDWTGHFLKNLTGLMGKTAGGDGGALPAAKPAPAFPSASTNAGLDPEIRNDTLAPLSRPVRTGQSGKSSDEIDLSSFDFSVPETSGKPETGKPAFGLDAETGEIRARPSGTTVSRPAGQEPAPGASVPETVRSLQGSGKTAGENGPDNRFRQTAEPASGVSATREIVPAASGPVSGTAEPVVTPGAILGRIENDRFKREVKTALHPFFQTNSDMAQGLAGWERARFDPEPLARYGKEERATFQWLVDSVRHLYDGWRYDPEMAKKQAYAFLDRINPAFYEGTVGFDKIGQGRFSLNEAVGQIRDFMQTGTTPSLAAAEQTARAMRDLDNTAYGKTVRNFVASVHTGMINLARDNVETALLILSSAPPLETAMFHYQQMYIAHGHDTAGFAHELEDMVGFSGKVRDKAVGLAEEAEAGYRSMRTGDYNRLKWFTLNPAEAAYVRPDRLTGDFFEKLLPAIFSMKLAGKVAQGTGLLQRGELFVKGIQAVKTAYSHAYYAIKRKCVLDPQTLERDKGWEQYRQESALPEADARELYIEAKARESGLQAGMLSLATFTAGNLFRTITGSAAESPAIRHLQQFTIMEGATMTKEAVDGAWTVNRQIENSQDLTR